MVPDVWALGVINPGTHKEAFTVGCTAGSLLMPAPVGRLGSCSRCFPLACLHASNARESEACYTYCIHVQYTMLQCASWRKCLLSSQGKVLRGERVGHTFPFPCPNVRLVLYVNKPTGNTLRSHHVYAEISFSRV